MPSFFCRHIYLYLRKEDPCTLLIPSVAATQLEHVKRSKKPNMNQVNTVVLLHTVLHCHFTSADSIENYLFEHYSASMKPRRNQNELVEIDIAMTIQTVLKVDERFQYISFYGWFEVQWRDEFLMWNETEYQGIKKIRCALSTNVGPRHIHVLLRGTHP